MRRILILTVLAGTIGSSSSSAVVARAGSPDQPEQVAKPEQAAPPATPAAGGNVTAPRRTKYVGPVYPAEAMARRIQGIVIVETLIDETGRVAEARVLRSIPELDQAALDAVRQWEFAPSLRDGKPTAVSLSVTVNFQLEQSTVNVGPEIERIGSARPPTLEAPSAQCPAETAAQKARRETAIQFVMEVGFRQRLAASETTGGGFRPLRELQSPPAVPDGYTPQLLISGDTYSLSVIDTRDACGASVFSDQRGVIYVGTPLK